MSGAFIFTGAKMDRVFIRHLLEDFSDNKLSSYFYVNFISPEKADRDYYLLKLGASPAMDSDKKFEPGFQSRIFLAMMNSYMDDELAFYDRDTTSLRIGTTSADYIFSFKDSLSHINRLDKSSYKKFDLFAGNKYSNFADFRAEMTEKGASLFVHRKNNVDEICEYILPFMNDGHKVIWTAKSIEALVKEDEQRIY